MEYEESLKEIFPELRTTSPVIWCGLCRVLSIKCNECGNISCNGGGCDVCHDNFELFNKQVAHKLYNPPLAQK